MEIVRGDQNCTQTHTQTDTDTDSHTHIHTAAAHFFFFFQKRNKTKNLTLVITERLIDCIFSSHPVHSRKSTLVGRRFLSICFPGVPFAGER